MKFWSFLQGMGSILNLFPSEPVEINSLDLDDAKALQSDWVAIGLDLEAVTDKCPAISFYKKINNVVVDNIPLVIYVQLSSNYTTFERILNEHLNPDLFEVQEAADYIAVALKHPFDEKYEHPYDSQIAFALWILSKKDLSVAQQCMEKISHFESHLFWARCVAKHINNSSTNIRP